MPIIDSVLNNFSIFIISISQFEMSSLGMLLGYIPPHSLLHLSHLLYNAPRKHDEYISP